MSVIPIPVAKQLRPVPEADQDRLLIRLGTIAAAPEARHPATTQMVGRPGAWRVGQGDRRAIYAIVGSDVIVARDAEAGTVTTRESDLAALMADRDDAEDLRSVQLVTEKIALGGIEAYRASCLDVAEVRRVLDGESVLKVMREKRGLTQAQLGNRAGVSTAMIGMIETGQRRPSVPALIRLAGVLEVSTDDPPT